MPANVCRKMTMTFDVERCNHDIHFMTRMESRGIAVVRSRYEATTSKDAAGWKRQRDL
jgi:hypothetical protein